MSDRELMRTYGKSVMGSSSASGAVGKGLVVAGGGYLVLSFLLSIIPFVGPVLAAAILVGVGLLMWE